MTDITGAVGQKSNVPVGAYKPFGVLKMNRSGKNPIGRLRDEQRPTLSMRLETVRCKPRRKIPIQCIAAALIEAGYTSLDEQAKALGLHRATTWTIIKTKHKLGRLNAKTAQRILANPDTPESVLAIIQRALADI